MLPSQDQPQYPHRGQVHHAPDAKQEKIPLRVVFPPLIQQMSIPSIQSTMPCSQACSQLALGTICMILATTMEPMKEGHTEKTLAMQEAYDISSLAQRVSRVTYNDCEQAVQIHKRFCEEIDAGRAMTQHPRCNGKEALARRTMASRRLAPETLSRWRP